MKNKKKIILWIAVILVMGGIVGIVTMRRKPDSSYESRPTVAAVQPERGDIVLYAELSGLIEPQSSASVQPKISGNVLEVNFRSGDFVEAGQILLSIESDNLTALRLQVDSAAVAAKEAAARWARIRVLFEGGYVSQQEMEQAQNADQNAKIAYEMAKNQYELQLGYTTVTAPISGIIESRTVDPHDYVGPGFTVCVISGGDGLQVKFGITERILSNLSIGDAILIEKNGTSYEGIITEIGTMVNHASGLYDVKASIHEAKGLTSGSRVKLTVVMERADHVLTVPVDAVDYDGGVPFVYCYEEGVARKTEIEAGIYDSEKMEVKSGLPERCQVIVTWSNELMDMQEVLLEESGHIDYSESDGFTKEQDGQVNRHD